MRAARLRAGHLAWTRTRRLTMPALSPAAANEAEIRPDTPDDLERDVARPALPRAADPPTTRRALRAVPRKASTRRCICASSRATRRSSEAESSGSRARLRRAPRAGSDGRRPPHRRGRYNQSPAPMEVRSSWTSTSTTDGRLLDDCRAVHRGRSAETDRARRVPPCRVPGHVPDRARNGDAGAFDLADRGPRWLHVAARGDPTAPAGATA